MVTQYRIFNIQYDTDDTDGTEDTEELPKELFCPVQDSDADDLMDVISDYIIDHTGFCHNGFEYEIVGTVV